MSKLRGIVALGVFLFLFGGLAVRAQQISSVNGVVSDKSGGSISGVSVALDNAQIGFHATTTTNELGFYQFLRLTPAEGYALTFTKSGFRTVTLRDITLQVST